MPRRFPAELDVRFVQIKRQRPAEHAMVGADVILLGEKISRKKILDGPAGSRDGVPCPILPLTRQSEARLNPAFQGRASTTS